MNYSFKFTISLLLLCLSAQVLAQPVEITCALPSANLPPYIYGQSDTLTPQNPGATPEHLLALFKNFKDIELKIVRLPFARIAADLKSGKVDCGISFDQQPGLPTEGRFFQVPLNLKKMGDEKLAFNDIKLLIYYHSDAPVHWTGNKLTPRVKVHSPMPQFNQYLEKHGAVVISENFDIERQLQQLNMKRIDGLLSLETLTDSIIEKNNLISVKKSEIPVANIKNYLVFSNAFYKNHPAVVKKIWTHVPRFKKTQEFKALRKKYKLN